VRQIKLTHVGFLAHVKIASRIVSYLQGIAEDAVAMCNGRQQSGDIVTVIGRHGQVSAFDACQHAALWTHTIQVLSSHKARAGFPLKCYALTLLTPWPRIKTNLRYDTIRLNIGSHKEKQTIAKGL